MVSSLKNNIQKGVKWSILVTLINTIIQPIYRIILAVMLLPTEFSYIAVITLIVSFAELLNNIGIGEALIQRDDISSYDLSTLFFFNFGVTLLITNIVYFSSNLIEHFYEMSSLSLIVKIITSIIFLSGITSIFKFYLHRNFKFKETSIIRMIKIISEIIIAVALIFLGLNIWGFIWGIIIANAINALLLTMTVFKKTNFRIRFYFSFNNLKKFLDFGVYVSLKRIITFISQKIDEIIIGGVLSAEILGIYFLAKNLLLQIQTLITTSFGQVLLPAFSRLKDDIEKQRKVYLKILSILIFVGLPIFIFIIMAAEIFVPIIFGEEWRQSSVVFQYLSLPTFFLLLSASVTTSLLYSQGKTISVFLVDLILVPFYILILSLFHNENLTNITLIYGGFLIIKFIVTQWLITTVINIKIKDYLKVSKGPLISSIIIILLSFILFFFKEAINDTLFLISYLLITIMLYLILNWIFDKDKMQQQLKMIKDTVKN